MSKKCFVIMPFGSDDPDMKKRFDGVYKGIIMPAIKEAGYDPLREDMSGTPGSIPKNIITKLATYDMVLADLTNGNANVFYELGIRHVMAKSATVLIINKDTKIPFDNSSYHVIQYTAELDDIDNVQKQIINAIRQREESPTLPDNSVHDTYNKLPVNLLEFVNIDDKTSQDKITTKLNSLIKENQLLKNKLKVSGIDLSYESTESTDINVRQAIFEARKGIKYSGIEVTITLRNYALSRNIDGFMDYLQEALEMGYMREDDYVQVYYLCRQLDIITVQLALLEVAYGRFPDSEDIIILLVRLYSESSDKVRNEKAVKIINNLMNIKSEQGMYKLSLMDEFSDGKLGSLFYVYNTLNMYNQVVSICESFKELDLPPSPLVLRNLANTYIHLGNFEKAKTTYESLMDLDYYNASNHRAFSGYYTKVKDYKQAYIEDELALALDSQDEDNYINIVIDIFNYGYIRKSADEIIRVNFDEQIDAVMPFFMRALEVENSLSMKKRIVDMLLRKNQKQFANAITDDAKIAQEFNTYPLEYIMQIEVSKKRRNNG